MLNIAMFGCAHLGYAPTGLRRKLDDGTNVIAADGFAAHRDIINDICDTANDSDGTTVIVDGGDLFHDPHPTPATIDVARDCDRIRADAGIEAFRLPGNHDRSSASNTPATAVLRDAPGSHIVAPSRYGVEEAEDTDPRRNIVVGGLYEIWQLTSPSDDGTQVYLHLINEQALSPSAGEMEPSVDPQPVAGGVNILVTHGIVPDPSLHYVQADERGGNRVIPTDWFHRGFTCALLSDLHSPSNGTLGGTPWAYTGSAVRRGFADTDTPRGWMQLTISDDGDFQLGFHPVEQRAAVDETIELPDDPTAAVAAVTGLLSDLEPRSRDAAAGKRTGDAGVRIRVTANAPSQAVFDAANAMIPEWSKSLPDALSLQVRVTGADNPTDLRSALESIPAAGDETPIEALRRMAADGSLTALSGLSESEVSDALDEAASVLSA